MDSSTRQQMTLAGCRLLAIFIWGATLTRPFVVELSAAFTLIGVVEGIFALVLYLTVRAELLGRAAPYFGCLAMPLLGLPLMLISGGVNSAYSFMLPIFPFYATLMLGARFSILVTSILCVLVAAMGLFSNEIVDLTQTPTSEMAVRTRAYWLVAALIGAAALSWSFNRLMEGLADTLREAANIDYLTRISNRRGLEKILEREVSSARRHSSWLSLILVDIDDFKKFNDAFGHSAGDRCLVKIADCLRNASRSRQDYVGRWGGEEFVIVLPDTDPQEAKSVAEVIRREIEFLVTEKNERGNVTATLGCCAGYGDECHTRQMIDAADRALYAGKARGKNRVVMGTLPTRPLPEEAQL